MKIPLTYGAIGALIGALINLGLFFAGQHDDPETATKNLAVAIPAGVIAFAIPIVLIVLAVRAWRNAQPDGAMSFGRGIGTATLTGLFLGLFGGVFHFAYLTFINPAWHEAMINLQLANFDKQSMPADARAMAEKWTRFMMMPALQAAMATVMWTVGGVVVGLIAGAILKRDPQGAPPVLPAA